MPKLTDPEEFALIRKIYFEKKELSEESDRQEKKIKNQTNQAR